MGTPTWILINAEGQVYTWNLREGVKGTEPDQQLVAKSVNTPGVVKPQFILVEACTEQTEAAKAEMASLREAMAESTKRLDDTLAAREVEVRQDYAFSIRPYHIEAGGQ